jgi:uncharacterized protein (TIGR03086 family)
MPDLLQLEDRALTNYGKLVANVPDDKWGAPTPCAEWNVRDLVNHVTAENLWIEPLFEGKTIAEVGDRFDGDVLGDNPNAAWEKAAAGARRALSKPGVLTTICHLSFGDTPGEVYIEQLLFDLVIHGWDLAKGSGQDTTIEPEMLQAVDDMVAPNPAQFANNDWFGPNAPGVDSSDQQTRLLAQLGRTA